MKAIILAAGQSVHLDGYHQLLVRDPKTENTILDGYIDIFGEKNITVIVGFRAIEIISKYPNLNYIYNKDWAVTNNSGSLGLIDNAEPGYVLSSDFFISLDLIDHMEQEGGNIILTAQREARGSNAVNCSHDNGKVNDIYRGRVKKLDDPESLGIFKIKTSELMSNWIKNCRNNPIGYVAENIRLDQGDEIKNMDIGTEFFFEINSVNDYINFLSERLKRG